MEDKVSMLAANALPHRAHQDTAFDAQGKKIEKKKKGRANTDNSRTRPNQNRKNPNCKNCDPFDPEGKPVFFFFFA